MTRPVRFLRRRPVGLLPLLGLLACGGGTAVVGSQPTGGLEITPRMATLPPGGSGTFSAFVQGALATSVDWSASAGSITSAGLLTAPTEVGSYQVRASYAGVTGVATATVVAPGTPAAMYATASAACSAMPVRTTGVTRYFCDCAAGAEIGCVAGNDANAGTSPTAPRRTWAQVISTFNAMSAGDTVALCKGGAWSSAQRGQLYNPRCAAAADMKGAANATTCDLRDFAPSWGGTAKPIVQQTTDQPTLLFQGTTRGVRIMNLRFLGRGGGPGGTGYSSERGVQLQGGTDFLICNNSFENLYMALHLQPDVTGTMTRITIWGNRILNCAPEAILGAASNSTVDANYMDNNGAFDVGGHVIYLNGHNVNNFSFVNNELRRTPNTPCRAVLLVAHDQFDGLNIENNIVDGGTGATASCWGIGVDSGNYPGQATWFRNVTIRRNVVQNVGWAGISVGQAPAPIIENNVVVMRPGSGYTGIAVPYGQPSRVGPPADDTTTAAVVRNNTIYIPAGSTGSPNGIHLGPYQEGTNHVIANNSVFFANGSGTCFNTTMPASSYAFVGNNACFGGTWGTAYDATARITANPLFVSAPTDFTPGASSPLIGAGSVPNAPTYDLTLRQRPSPPSVGAMEP